MSGFDVEPCSVNGRCFSVLPCCDPHHVAPGWEAKYEKDIECGGGYVKVGPKLSDPTSFGDPTTYNIMFGPDKCGYTKRTHLIFNYKGKNVLKKSDLAYKQEGEGTSHVYRLVLKPDNTARVEIDGEKIYEGSLKEDWELLAPKEIKDPDDKKPSDWVDDSMMDDPADKKPENWVEEKRIWVVVRDVLLYVFYCCL